MDVVIYLYFKYWGFYFFFNFGIVQGLVWYGGMVNAIQIEDIQFSIKQQEYLNYKSMSKQRLSRDYKPSEIFRMELSNQEMNYIASRLPPGYSFVLEPKKNLPKHVIQAVRKKANMFQNEDSNSHPPVGLSKYQALINKKNLAMNPPPKPTSQQKIGAQKPPVNTNNVNNKWVDQVNDGLKRAAKILVLLKAHKNSWPFLEPVDADALEIPEYYEIIKQPMDLKTVQNRIKTQKYTDFSEFQQDIMKIIENSYRFNQANEDYLKITSQFQNYFTKLASQTQDIKNPNKNNKKKKKSAITSRQYSDAVPVTLMQKKLLAQQIRRLAKQHLKGIRTIVFDHPDQQEQTFDLEKLSQKKLRQLQKYVRNRIIAMEERNRSNQLQKTQISNLNMFESDQSPFLTDSGQE